jgi:hypothetical protein
MEREPKDVRWKATWITPAGNPTQAFFYSVTQYNIARVDFQILLMDSHRTVPGDFDLVEAPSEFEQILVLPHPTETGPRGEEPQ